MGWINIIFLVAVGLYAALRIFLALMIFVTHLIEVRPVCALVPADRDEVFEQVTSMTSTSTEFNPYEQPRSSTPTYADDRNRRAEELGFVWQGLYKSVKGGIYQSRFALWESESRDILAVVVWGTTAKIKLDKTILYTPIDGGRYLVSSDRLTGVIAPRVIDNQVFWNYDLDRLVDRHRQRLRESGNATRTFTGRDGFADYQELRARLIQSFVDQGEAYYLGPDRAAVRSSLKGAFLGVLRTFKPPKIERG